MRWDARKQRAPVMRNVRFPMAKILAKEWLLGLACIATGALAIGPIVSVLAGGGAIDFYLALARQNESMFFWRAVALLLAPYVFMQLLRSIIWAVRNSR